MRIYLALLLLLSFNLLKSQDHELRFDCFDHDIAQCNPFAINSRFCPDQGFRKNDWRVSHGSPQLRTFSGNNPTRVAVLKAKDTDGFSPKGEGIFMSYNFIANRNYTIEFILRIEDPAFASTISVESKAANGLTARTSQAECGEESLPSVSDTQTIQPKSPVPYRFGNELGRITRTNFVPTKNFNYMWIYAVPEGFGDLTSEFVIKHITITDVTTSITNNTICCDQNFTTSSANPTQITGSTPSGGNGSFSYQWQEFSFGRWAIITNATDQNYDPPTINQTREYKRIVSSGSEISESNIISITFPDSNQSWYDICCDQSYPNPTVPEPIRVNAPPPNGIEIIFASWYKGGLFDWESPIYQPPMLEETTKYRLLQLYIDSNNDVQQFASNILTINIDDLIINDNQYSSSETVEACRPIDIQGNLTTSVGADVDIVSGSSITIKANSLVGDGFHLKINECDNPMWGGGTSTSGRSTSNPDETILFNDVRYDTYVLETQVISSGNDEFIVVYPNPSNGQISLSFDPVLNTSGSTIKIYNSSGLEVYSQNINDQLSTLDLDLLHLTYGNYLLKFWNSEYEINKQIFIE